MRKPLIVLPTALAIGLVGCVATMPIGPTARVMPAPNKPFEVFVHEEGRCRDYAYQRAGGVEAGEAAARSGLASAAVGTAVGAAVGALAGGGRGAGVGAAGGLLVGSASGVNAAGASTWELQRRYDLAYEQCMYAAGNQVPGYRAPHYLPPPRPAGGAER
jgi:YmgG-like glycine-zipper protein